MNEVIDEKDAVRQRWQGIYVTVKETQGAMTKDVESN